MIFTARVVRKDGEKPVIVPDSPSDWLALLSRRVGKRITVEIRSAERRSNTANAYLFGPVYDDILAGLRAIAFDAGEAPPIKTKAQLHSAMKSIILGRRVVKLPGGVTIEDDVETKGMDSTTFSEFISQVKRFVAERWSIYVRDPDEGVWS